MGNKDDIKVFQSFKTFADTEPIVSQLTDAEAGRIWKACFGCYFRGETLKFRPEDDRLFRGAWGTIEMKLLSERKKDSEISKSRSEAGREGGKAKGKGKKQMQASVFEEKQMQASVPTYTDTVTGTNSSTLTISSTVTNTNTNTDTEHAYADSDSADRPAGAAAAEGAAPQSVDLFSVKQLQATVKKNKVNLTKEGIQVFHEEMQDSRWLLYGEPVEKKYIVRVLREYAKKHPEYSLEQEGEPEKKEAGKPNLGMSIIKKTTEYMTDEVKNEYKKQGILWIECIPDYYPKETFTEDELEYLKKFHIEWD